MPMAIGCLGIFLLTAFTHLPSSSISTQESNASTSPLLYKIKELTYLWDLLVDTHAIDRATDDTWLDVGLRAKYAVAKKYATIEMLEAAAGMPIFNRGPHGATLDFNSNYTFGYYNPEFLAAIKEQLQIALENPAFKLVAQRAFNQHVAKMAETYRNAYLHQVAHPDEMRDIRVQYLESMAQPNGTTEGSLQEMYRGYADTAAKEKGADWYEAVTAPSFWIRRSIDGTDGQFFELLELVIAELGAKG